MAFCPNCGTPNTKEAAKCVSCGTGLTPASGGSKFKGTIMMGVASPAAAPQPQQPQAQPAPAPAQPQAQQQPQAPQQGGEQKNLAFQKTMMGPMVAPPPGGAPAAPAPAPAPAPDPASAAGAAAAAQPDAQAMGSAPTVEQANPLPQGQASMPQAAPSMPQAADPGGFTGDQPVLPQSNATKMMMMVLGAAVLLAALIIGAALVMRDSGEPGAEGAEGEETSQLQAPEGAYFAAAAGADR